MLVIMLCVWWLLIFSFLLLYCRLSLLVKEANVRLISMYEQRTPVIGWVKISLGQVSQSLLIQKKVRLSPKQSHQKKQSLRVRF